MGWHFVSIRYWFTITGDECEGSLRLQNISHRSIQRQVQMKASCKFYRRTGKLLFRQNIEFSGQVRDIEGNKAKIIRTLYTQRWLVLVLVESCTSTIWYINETRIYLFSIVMTRNVSVGGRIMLQLCILGFQRLIFNLAFEHLKYNTLFWQSECKYYI